MNHSHVSYCDLFFIYDILIFLFFYFYVLTFNKYTKRYTSLFQWKFFSVKSQYGQVLSKPEVIV